MWTKQSSKVNSLPIIVHVSLMILKISFSCTFQITIWTGIGFFTCMYQNVSFNVKSPFGHFLTEWTSPEPLANLDWCLQKWKAKLRHLGKWSYECLLLSCFERFHLMLHLNSQYLQENGLPPVCIKMWVFILLGAFIIFGQNGHPHCLAPINTGPS